MSNANTSLLGSRVILPPVDGAPLEKGVIVDNGAFEGSNASTLIVIVDPVYRTPVSEAAYGVSLGAGSREVANYPVESGAVGDGGTALRQVRFDSAPSPDSAADAAAVALHQLFLETGVMPPGFG